MSNTTDTTAIEQQFRDLINDVVRLVRATSTHTGSLGEWHLLYEQLRDAQAARAAFRPIYAATY